MSISPFVADADEAEPEAVLPRRRTNYVRNAYHVLNAVAVVLAVEYLLTTWSLRIAVGVLGFAAAWSMEIGRRLLPAVNRTLMRLFAPVAHPHEAHQVNSATWYTTAVLLLALAAPVSAGVAGLAVLGIGDPLAAVIGRRYGRTRLCDGRTLEGSLAFVGGGFAAAWATLALWHPDAGPAVWTALAAAVGGAVAEIAARRMDDNLLIPVVAAGCAWGVQRLT